MVYCDVLRPASVNMQAAGKPSYNKERNLLKERSTMEKFIPYAKLSKKKKRELDAKVV